MDVRVHEIGDEKCRVVVIDDVLPEAEVIVDVAAALAPYPAEARVAYPGLRRIITPADAAADAYVVALLQAAAPFIGGVFEADSFDLTEASFSLVTRRPEGLAAAQRVPHYDSTDVKFLAILHYLNAVSGSGTAFYRHRASGIVRVSPDNVGELHARTERLGAPGPGFIGVSDDRYEQLLRVEGRFNRLVIYQGALLHSGLIPEDFDFSPDPRRGRLTGNIFVRLA